MSINGIKNNLYVCNDLKEQLTINAMTSQITTLQNEKTVLQMKVLKLESYISVLSDTYIIKDTNGNVIKYNI
jgi:hypothetical protein